ncbi:MAG: hypothetical protein P4L40_05320, partial [Terracidiphilus sp.]|nr:hypothetical protein [Terracidiphilus sp.]
GQLLSDPDTFRHVLLNNNLWLSMTQAAQKLFLSSLFKCTSAGDMHLGLRKFNRAVLRQQHIMRYLLMATIDCRLTAARLPELLLLLRMLLLDDVPYQPHIAAFASFLSATLSGQLSQVLTRLNGDTETYPIIDSGTPVEPLSAWLSSPEPAIPSSRSKRVRADILATVQNQVIVTVRNHLLSLLPWLIHVVTSTESMLTVRYRAALFREMPLRWLGLFLDSSHHITTVTSALKLTVELMPLYGPRLVGPEGERALAKVRPLGHKMPTFHYLSEDAAHVGTVAEHLALLFHIVLGLTLPADAPPDAVYNIDALAALAGLTPTFRYPDFYHIIARIVARSFTAPVDAPSMGFAPKSASRRKSGSFAREAVAAPPPDDDDDALFATPAPGASGDVWRRE